MAGFNLRPPPRTDPLLPYTSSAAALRLHYPLRNRLSFGLFLHSSLLKSCSRFGHVPRLKDLCNARALHFTGLSCLGQSLHALSSTLMSFSFFDGHESGSDSSKKIENSQSRTSGGAVRGRRRWTNIILASNILVFLSDVATNGLLCSLGAKINSCIIEGQLWRLVTSSFLHAGIGHLLVNCFSLNSVGPTVESLCGPKRYLVIYVGSAIASSTMSYWFCKGPAVGASGAIFGLVGSCAVYLLRHRGLSDSTGSGLRRITEVIIFNLALGLLNSRIDNWGHIGGLIGGAAMSWLIGPAWKFESISPDGRRVFKDNAPINSLIRRQPK